MQIGPVIAVIVGVAAAGLPGWCCAASAGTPEPSRVTGIVNKDCVIELSPPKGVIVGVPAELVLKITPAAPWVVKTETPFAVLLEASPALQLNKAALDAKDFIDPKSLVKAVRTTCVAQSRGPQTLSAKMSFFLCSHEMCKHVVEQVSTVITAN